VPSTNGTPAGEMSMCGYETVAIGAGLQIMAPFRTMLNMLPGSGTTHPQIIKNK